MLISLPFFTIVVISLVTTVSYFLLNQPVALVSFITVIYKVYVVIGRCYLCFVLCGDVFEWVRSVCFCLSN